MDNLIEIEKLIKTAKKAGVELGKGDPYNRLRYYTKIGWLPNMVRRKSKTGDVKGHYPKWVLERLILIEKLKQSGLNNDQIAKKINSKNKMQTLYERLNTQEFKNKVISYMILSMLFLILLNELNVINLSKSKTTTVQSINDTNVPAFIIDSGNSFVPADKNRIFVKNQNITTGSRVYVTFNQSYSPATRFWVSKVEPQKGFYVELDAPVFDNTEFSWWISK